MSHRNLVVRRLARETNISLEAAQERYAELCTVIQQLLVEGCDVRLTGVGKIVPDHHPAPHRAIVRFVAGKGLRAALRQILKPTEWEKDPFSSTEGIRGIDQTWAAVVGREHGG